jgi:hypothetical protein
MGTERVLSTAEYSQLVSVLATARTDQNVDRPENQPPTLTSLAICATVAILTILFSFWLAWLFNRLEGRGLSWRKIVRTLLSSYAFGLLLAILWALIDLRIRYGELRFDVLVKTQLGIVYGLACVPFFSFLVFFCRLVRFGNRPARKRKSDNSIPVWIAVTIIASLVVIGTLRIWVEWMHEEQIMNWCQCLIVAWACLFCFSVIVTQRRGERTAGRPPQNP